MYAAVIMTTTVVRGEYTRLI